MIEYIYIYIYIYFVYIYIYILCVIYDLHLRMIQIPSQKKEHAQRQVSRVHQWRLRVYGAATCHFLWLFASQKSNRQEDKSVQGKTDQNLVGG